MKNARARPAMMTATMVHPARRLAAAERADMLRAVARVALLTLSYTLLAVLFTWPLASHATRGVTSAIDPVDSIWRMGWGAHQLLHHPFHLFTGNTFYPFPDSYLFDELVLGAAVLTLPLALLSVAPLAIYNIAVLLSLVLSALAMYALARRFGAIPIAAFGAGIIYAFAPMHLDRIGHIGLLSAQWFPLILLFLDRMIERPRPREALALAACLIMQAISSQYYAIYLVFLVPLFLVFMLVRRPAARSRAVWLHLALSGMIAVAVIAPLAVGYRRVQTMHDVERTYGQATYYGATLANFITADGSNRLWGTLTASLRGYGTYTFERNMFPGLLALLLAAFGAWMGRRRRWERFLVALVIVAGVLSFGPELRLTPASSSLLLRHLPYGILYWHVPGFDSMRVPARFGTLFLLGIAGLAASGITALVRGLTARAMRRPRLHRAAPIAVCALLIAGFGAEYANRPLPIVPLESGADVPPVYRWLADQPDARAIELPLVIPDHPREQEIAVREQYFSLTHDHPIVNGNANVLPKGYKALVMDMKRFPSQRSITLLQGLGITHVIIHFDQFSSADRAAMTAGLMDADTALTPAAQFGDTAVYRLAPSERLAALQAVIAPGASIMLSRNDPLGSSAYMGMIGYVLRDHPVYARMKVDYGEGYAGPPEAGRRYDYAILYANEDPAQAGFAGGEIVWQDSVVRVYRR